MSLFKTEKITWKVKMAEPIVEEETIPVEQDAPASPEVFNIEKNLEINPFERNFTPVNLPVDKDWVV